MRKTYSSLFLHISIFFFFLAFIFLNNCLWVIKDDVFHHPDARKYVKYGVHFYSGLRNLIFEEKIGLKTPRNFVALFAPPTKVWDELERPKLIYFPASIMAMIFGLSMDILDMSNILYVIILILSLYHIGKKLGNKNAGLFAGFITFMYPGIFAFSRYFSPDFPLTAMVALNIYLLIRTENFKDVRYSILFGLAFGLGILTKLQIVFFLIAPLGYLLIRRMVSKREDFTRCIRNLLLALGLAALISSPHWFKNISDLLLGLAGHTVSTPTSRFAFSEAAPYPFSFAWFFFYLNRSITCISPIFFIAFIVGSVVFFKSELKKKFLLLWWIIGGYLIFTIITAKSGRYYLPALPAFALISSFGILGLRNKWTKFFIVAFLILFGIKQWVGLSFGITLFPIRYERLISSPLGKIEKAFPFMKEWNPRFYAPGIRKNNYEEVVKTFIKEINSKRKSKILLISERYYGFTINSIESLFLVNRPDLKTVNVHNWDVGEVNEGKELNSEYITVIANISSLLLNLDKLEMKRQNIHLLKTDLLLPSQIEISFWRRESHSEDN